MPVNADPSDDNADVYVSVADADAYFAQHLYASAWNSALEATKESALVQATRTLDASYQWVGVNTYMSRTLRWPRTGVVDPDNRSIDAASIPSFLEDATAEFALSLIESNRLADADTAGFSEIKVASIGLKIDKYDRAPAIPTLVDNLLAPYGQKKATGPNSVAVGDIIRG